MPPHERDTARNAEHSASGRQRRRDPFESPRPDACTAPADFEVFLSGNLQRLGTDRPDLQCGRGFLAFVAGWMRGTTLVVAEGF